MLLLTLVVTSVSCRLAYLRQNGRRRKHRWNPRRNDLRAEDTLSTHSVRSWWLSPPLCSLGRHSMLIQYSTVNPLSTRSVLTLCHSLLTGVEERVDEDEQRYARSHSIPTQYSLVLPQSSLGTHSVPIQKSPALTDTYSLLPQYPLSTHSVLSTPSVPTRDSLSTH